MPKANPEVAFQRDRRWLMEYWYIEAELERAVQQFYAEWREAHPQETIPVLEQEERFGCSACDGWFAPPELAAFEVWGDTTGFQNHVAVEHPDRMDENRPIIKRKPFSEKY